MAKAWAARREHRLPPFAALGDPRAVAAVSDVPVAVAADLADAAARFDEELPILTTRPAGAIVPGHPDADGARSALDALEAAVALARSGEAAAVVTAPVSKAQLYAVGFAHPGQTEFVADRCGLDPADAVMMLAGPSLRVVPLTTHVPLGAVPALLDVDLVVRKVRVTARDLRRRFGIAAPRLVVAGLNPHAGEDGAIGREEIDVLAPAIAALRAEGVDVTGPFAADTLFHPRARARYDAAICPYHDQALVPLKTLHFDEGVNVTLGLPIVRTAPDHGTAFALAGRNEAHPGAMIAAIRMAGEMAAR